LSSILTEETLKGFESKLRNYWNSNETNAGMTDSIVQICEELISSYRWISREYISVKDDYDSLIAIMDRARKLAYLAAEDEDRECPMFKMDSDGNLTRIEE
jgi:hypothetical protein